jgi:hypothetical protein
VAEIKIERKQQRSLLPWILGLVVLLLVIWALTKTMNRSEAAPADRDGSAASDTLRDDTPPRLRQYARVTGVAEIADIAALAA